MSTRHFIRTFGCQMNEYDSAKIADVLASAEGMQPAALPADVLVKFTVDPAGHVNRVWILTDAEAAQPDPRR